MPNGGKKPDGKNNRGAVARRKSQRVDAKGDRIVLWGADGQEFDAVVCDLSFGGCYLNTAHEASVGQTITIGIPTYTKPETIQKFTATVIPQKRKLVGFGVSFPKLDAKQEKLLLRLMETFKPAADRRD
ncbi:MAG: PilZ domain-containing protein [Pyrinomonadaceae bacterium]